MAGASARAALEGAVMAASPTQERSTAGDARWARARERLGERLGPVACERASAPCGWEIVERRVPTDHLAAAESVFAVGNGYLGLRGSPDEGAPAHDPGAILNGLYETWPIVYPEDAHGLARTGQTVVNAPDTTVIRLLVDDEPFDLSTACVLRFERVLEMRAGVLRREVEYATARGHRMLVRSRRLVSLEHRALAAMRYEVTALDAGVRVAIVSEVVTHDPRRTADDPRRGAGFADKPLVPVAARAAATRCVLQLATRHSGLELACGIEHDIEAPSAVAIASRTAGDAAAVELSTGLRAGERATVAKYAAYHWSVVAARRSVATRVDHTLDRASAKGYARIEDGHRRRVAAFWRRSDVTLDGAPELQQAVRFNLFQLMQATARAEGHGVPAKGVTGRGYDGHYFWDTEIYVVPFLIHTDPGRARSLLAFRCRMLDAARRRAREVGHRGALFPWRTIGGEEASAWYAAGTAQYHINADIAYALQHYVFVTGDLAFLLDRATDVMVETARLWMELGFFSERRDGRFCINGVTGPDEYTTVVDNNAYTNLMARTNLEGAIRICERLKAREPDAYAGLVRRTGVGDEEVARWRAAAERMFVARHDELGIVLQDDGFLEREPWDFDATPPGHYPLFLHYHPLELYRRQVIKQADVVLATYLLDDAFTPDERRRTFDYYDPLTTGDSTLSACIQSIVASAVGYPDRALEYFVDACAVDLIDAHRNTADGIHVASCGGTWLALVAGFGGLRDFGGTIRFHPRLPADWRRLRFRVAVRGQLVEVDMTAGGTAYRLVEGPGLVVEHFGEQLRLVPGATVHRRRDGVGPAISPVRAGPDDLGAEASCCASDCSTGPV
jgi:alpha,alpha-trehalose phosphorylase